MSPYRTPATQEPYTVVTENLFRPGCRVSEAIKRDLDRLIERKRAGAGNCSARLVISADVADRVWSYGVPKEVCGVVVIVIHPGEYVSLCDECGGDQ